MLLYRAACAPQDARSKLDVNTQRRIWSCSFFLKNRAEAIPSSFSASSNWQPTATFSCTDPGVRPTLILPPPSKAAHSTSTSGLGAAVFAPAFALLLGTDRHGHLGRYRAAHHRHGDCARRHRVHHIRPPSLYPGDQVRVGP